ncbi:MAG: type VI secretion system baseplate subunit TssF, partial [Tepidisphaeraceae bacterium]
MDRRLLNYYNRELQHIREMGAEFAREFPKIAGRLTLDEFSCADPYVERLIEGFAFLAARVQLKLDAEFPRFTQSLLNTIYPH